MEPVEFISLAGKLVALGPAGARSASSRAYYGAFHEARKVLTLLGVKISRSGTAHAIVQGYLLTVPDPRTSVIGTLLSLLHGARNSADYSLDDPLPDQMSKAQESVEMAHDIVRMLQDLQQACEADESIRQNLLAAASKVDEARKGR